MNSGVSLSKSIHKLSIGVKGTIAYWANTDILNGNLFFQDTYTEYLWVTDGTNGGSHVLEYNEQPIQLNLHSNTLRSYQGSIYYINKSDGNTLWKTDGQNFEQISAESFSTSKGLKVFSNHLVGALSDNTLVLIDGNGIKNLDLGGLSDNSINSICIFGENNYILDSHLPDSSNHLYHVKDGQAQVIDGSVDNSGSFLLSLVNDNTCFYEYSIGDFQEVTTPSFIAVDDTGLVTKIETEINGENNNTWTGIVEYKGSVYFYPKNKVGDNSNKFLYEYENLSLSANENLVLPSSTLQVFSSRNYLYVKKYLDIIVDPIPPGYIDKEVLVFDSNFNNIYRFQSDQVSHKILSDDSGVDTIVFDNEASALGFIQADETQVLQTSSISLNKVIGDSKNTFLYGGDRNNANVSSVYVIKNKAVISQNSDGLWYAPEHQSQGLSIHTGERIDGSQYLFASYYFFKDGIPFWVVGSSELEFEKTITINMNEYTGSSPYIPNNTGQNLQSINYGSLTLEALSCDVLSFQMTLADNSSYTLNMERLGRSQAVAYCYD